MFGSAYLALPTPAAAAQNLSAMVQSIKLPANNQTEAFAQSIRQSLRQAQPAAAGVLVAAALGADESSAVSQGFLLVSSVMCCCIYMFQLFET